MLTCYICGETKPEAEFAFADMAKGTRQRHCRKCQAAYRHAHYLANRDDYIRREVTRMAGYRAANRPLLLAYLLDHPCVDCGVSEPVVLDLTTAIRPLSGTRSLGLPTRNPGLKCWLRSRNATCAAPIATAARPHGSLAGGSCSAVQQPSRA